MLPFVLKENRIKSTELWWNGNAKPICPNRLDLLKCTIPVW